MMQCTQMQFHINDIDAHGASAVSPQEMDRAQKMVKESEDLRKSRGCPNCGTLDHLEWHCPILKVGGLAVLLGTVAIPAAKPVAVFVMRQTLKAIKCPSGQHSSVHHECLSRVRSTWDCRA